MDKRGWRSLPRALEVKREPTNNSTEIYSDKTTTSGIESQLQQCISVPQIRMKKRMRNWKFEKKAEFSHLFPVVIQQSISIDTAKGKLKQLTKGEGRYLKTLLLI